MSLYALYLTPFSQHFDLNIHTAHLVREASDSTHDRDQVIAH